MSLLVSGACAGTGSPDAADQVVGGSAVVTSTAQVAATVITISPSSFREVVNGSGLVTARVGHIASLAAPAPTRVTGVNVSVGQRVRVGQSLVSFERVVFDAEASTADAALLTAEQASARARRLVDVGVSPRRELEIANSALAAARAASSNAHRSQTLATLTSPLAGVVTRLDVRLGANVDVGQTLVEITDTSHLDVQLFLPPAAASKVRIGLEVQLRDGTAGSAAITATGVIADISPVVDSVTRGVLVRVAVRGRQRVLRIGESLYGEIATTTHVNVVVIPEEALVPTGEGFRVFIVDSAGVAHARAVTVGARAAHRVWISDGLTAGETLVTTGAYGMDDGANVVVKKAGA